VIKYFVCLSAFLLMLFIVHAQPRRTIDFNGQWKFFLGDDSLARNPNYNDLKWRQLDLPHDWSIEGKFSESNPATTQGGALPGGIGWYRKHFTLSEADLKKNISIEFDGIYRNSEVWINGHYLGKRPNGYISFQYELTSYLKVGENIIAVKVDNSAQPNSRWYSGSGIYRNVRLGLTNPEAAVDDHKYYIYCDQFSKDSFTVTVRCYLKSMVKGRKNVSTVSDIYDAEGRLVAAHKKTSIDQFDFDTDDVVDYYTTGIRKPRLWSVDDPYLYKVITKVVSNGKVIDEYQLYFGIRNFYFDKDSGFFLNGKPLKIKGVCMHHDLGALGAAVNKTAIKRQLGILKSMGCNAIRTSHNPPAPELLELCDQMGFLVMDEAFDMWRKKKNKYDYSIDFDQWHEQDLTDMVMRDRNHPSVFMWSIGNEIREQFDSTGIDITRELVSIVNELDPTRPVTAALSEWNPEKNFMYRSGALDVVGLNYHHEVYADFQKHFPGQSMIGAENVSALETRGHYDLPSDTLMKWPQHSPLKYVEGGNKDYTVSAYDQVSAYWGSTHEETWKIIKKYPFLSGMFVWTGFDYLGEPTPYPWPARSSYFGIVDLAGFPKDIYYMYQSEWTSKPVLHLFPHWNWKPGQIVDVWCYYSQADEVELYLNGRSLGKKSKQHDDLHVMWRVPFEPGELKVVSRKNGKRVLEQKIHTAGKPYKIELTTNRSSISADGRDLAFVTAKVLDRDGNLVPDADNLIRFSISGTSKIRATDNGYQADLTPFYSTERKAWKGMGLVIVQSALKKGNSTLTAKAAGLIPASINIKTP